RALDACRRDRRRGGVPGFGGRRVRHRPDDLRRRRPDGGAVRRLIGIAVVLLLAGCAVPIEVEPKGEGKYDLTIENDFNTRTQGAERLLAKKAEELCPDGYDRLRRRALYKRRAVTEHINWEIQCS